jgi:hypothetical protein
VSAEPLFPRADKAARSVDPMVMAQALDHIAKTAAKSRTQTRRLRWIEQRATFALEGREYRDIDVELPKDAVDTAQRMKWQRDALKRVNRGLIEAADALLLHLERIGMTREEQPLMDALRGAAENAHQWETSAGGQL